MTRRGSKTQQKASRNKVGPRWPIGKQEDRPGMQLIIGADNDTQIWALKKVRSVHAIVENTVKSLAELEIIKFIRITANAIQASSELGGNKLKVPVTMPFHPTATGVHLVYDFELKSMEFYEMNSPTRGSRPWPTPGARCRPRG